MNKIAFPIFSCRWTIHAWNKKIGKFSAIAPNPRFNDAENCHFPEQLVFAHHIIARGGKGIFPIFYSKREERNDKFLFFTFMFCVKKTFLEKKLSFFVIFLISIFRFFVWKQYYAKKMLSSLIKNVIIYHFLFAALVGSWFECNISAFSRVHLLRIVRHPKVAGSRIPWCSRGVGVVVWVCGGEGGS